MVRGQSVATPGRGLLGFPVRAQRAALLVALLSLAVGADAAPALSRYDATASEGARELKVEATFPPGTSEDLVLPEGYEDFVRNAEGRGNGGWRPLPRRGHTLTVPTCPRHGCRIRYAFALAEAASGRRDRRRLFEQNGVFAAPLEAWMVRPLGSRDDARFRLRVETPSPIRFVTGVTPSADGAADTYEGAFHDLPWAPYSAFGPFESSQVRVSGATIEVAVSPGPLAIGKEGVLRWVSGAASAVVDLFGRFPVPRLAILVLTGGRRSVGFGTTMGNGGASIMIWVGGEAQEADLRKDWVLVHEMIHTGFPNMPRHQRWIEEGLATYLEGLVRARAGLIPQEEAWRGLVDGLPKGQPEASDQGLDRTGTWGRTYWGGALFAFVADLEIRERTENRHSLDDALKGILGAGGSIHVSWDLDRALRAGDRAIGASVLVPLHARWGETPVKVDLEAIWKRLGVTRGGTTVAFDDTAPLAPIRRSMTAPRPAAAEGRK